MYEKIIKDSWGDPITVTGESGVVTVETGRMNDFDFSPRRARKLARALKRAARQAERAL